MNRRLRVQALTIRRDSFIAEEGTCRRRFRADATENTVGRSEETLCGRSLGCGAAGRTEPRETSRAGGRSLGYGAAEGTEPREISRAEGHTLRYVAKQRACRTSLRSVISIKNLALEPNRPPFGVAFETPLLEDVVFEPHRPRDRGFLVFTFSSRMVPE